VKNTIVYTAIFGGYDLLRKPLTPGHFVCTHDGTVEIPDGWESRQINNHIKHAGYSSRYYKITGGDIFDESRYSIWLDGNIQLKVPSEELVKKYLAHGDIAIHKHPTRDCAYDEADVCMRQKLDRIATLMGQKRYYNLQCFPQHFGLWETGVLIRRHTKAIRDLSTAWWEELQSQSIRDQIGLPYVLWLSKIKPVIIPGNLQSNSGTEFTYYQHTKGRL